VASSECKKRPASSSGGSSKKAKADTEIPVIRFDPDTGELDPDMRVLWEGMIVNDEMKRSTLVQLKEICKALKLPVSGTKVALEERIKSCLSGTKVVSNSLKDQN
jgi:hypothetical protein